MTWRLAIALSLAACGAPMQPPGGGDDIGPPPGDDPFVQLASISCGTIGADTVDLTIEADVTLATDNAVDITISIPVPPGGSSFNQFFSCAGWNPVDVGGNVEGCHRTDPGQQATERIVINHTETVFDGVTPPVDVGIVINVRPAPFDPGSLASDAMNVQCGSP